MRTVLDRLAGNRNRVLLFDAPPLLGAPEALVLSEAVGQIIMVVKAGATERKAVAAAVQPLDKKKAINFLLNQVVRAHGDSYGGYHYGYSYEALPDAAERGRHRVNRE
jgi:receptor protein-tyrosine kinase